MLACDLASSSHFPLDKLPPDAALLDVMGEIIESESFYASANPNLILELWQNDELLRGTTTEPDLLEPWLWTGPRIAPTSCTRFELSAIMMRSHA